MSAKDFADLCVDGVIDDDANTVTITLKMSQFASILDALVEREKRSND